LPGADFDNYVEVYRDIINRVSSISGEQFEFFIQVRLGLMKDRIAKQRGSFDSVRILDFGCGTGATEEFLRDSFPSALICAVDSSAESIRAAQARNLDDVRFVHLDSPALPFPDDYFDLVYSNGTFHHIELTHHNKVLSEISRVCRDRGNLFIFENNPKNPLMMRAMRNNPFDVEANLVHPKWLQRTTESSGFRQKEVCYYFFFPRPLRFLRFTEKWLGGIPFGAQYFHWSIKTTHIG